MLTQSATAPTRSTPPQRRNPARQAKGERVTIVREQQGRAHLGVCAHSDSYQWVGVVRHKGAELDGLLFVIHADKGVQFGVLAGLPLSLF
jgi:hypothetical protein